LIFKDNSNFKLKGVFQIVARNVKTNERKILEEENVVVSQARKFIRDLMVENGKVITNIQIGDMNKDLSDDVSNLGDPSYSDTKLENKFFNKDYTSREAITYEDRPAIKYEFVINEDEANDDDNDDHHRKMWCEYALANEDGDIWNRKIKPIIKDDETEITIYWIFIL